MKNRRSDAEWAQIVKEYRTGRMTQRALSERHGISVASLKYHLKKDDSRSSFVEVPASVVRQEASSTTELEVTFPDGTVVRIRS